MLILDQVVCRQHQHLRVITTGLLQLQCSHGNSSGGVTAKRFEDVALGVANLVDRAVLVLSLEQQFTIGNGHDFRNPGQPRGAQEGFLNEVLTVRQCHERFGMRFARNWPQTAADTT
ncbi:hypothetical protein D3C79_833170 [compost metagenome]